MTNTKIRVLAAMLINAGFMFQGMAIYDGEIWHAIIYWCAGMYGLYAYRRSFTKEK